MSSQYENGSSKRLSMDELTRMNAPPIPRSTSQDEVLKRLESMNAALTNTLREQSKEIAELKYRLDQWQENPLQENPLPDGKFRVKSSVEKTMDNLRIEVMKNTKMIERVTQRLTTMLGWTLFLGTLIFSLICFLVLR